LISDVDTRPLVLDAVHSVQIERDRGQLYYHARLYVVVHLIERPFTRRTSRDPRGEQARCGLSGRHRRFDEGYRRLFEDQNPRTHIYSLETLEDL
jgi:hypothetical protein